MSTWEETGLKPELVSVITHQLEFTTPTPVQKASIPLFISNKDVCVESCTGSGKTLCFVMPIFHKLLARESSSSLPFALILTPSRELANQIFEVAKQINSHLGDNYTIDCFIGGRSLPEDIQKIENGAGQIIIATPGRLDDLLGKENTINFKDIEILVLDEADRLLDLGFKEKIHSIIEKVPKQRRTGLFSATMTTQVEALVRAGLRNPAYISVKVKSSISQNKKEHTKHYLPKGLSNYYSLMESYYDKFPGLVGFLKSHLNEKIIVFLGTCASTNFYTHILPKAVEGMSFYRLHGKMKQSQRDRVYEQFSNSDKGVLLTTDLIARGIDFQDINWIVQFDAPQNPDYFVHRIGRTARANKVGNTILFLLNKEDSYLNFLKMRNIEMNYIELEKNYECYHTMKNTVLNDREIYEKAQSAFVGYLRYYKEHQLSYIFEFKHLDLGYLAQSFCLLRIPRVKEILGKSIDNFVQSEVDPESIKFKDPKKEKQRAQEKERKALEIAEVKKKRKEKKQRTRTEKRTAKRKSSYKDLKEFVDEERIIRKIKKGQLQSQEVQEFINENPEFTKLFRKKRH